MLCSSRMRRCSQGLQVWGFTLQRDLEHPLGVGLHAVANLRPIRQHPAAGNAPHHRCSVAVQPCNGMNEVACAPPDPGGCCIIGFILKSTNRWLGHGVLQRTQPRWPRSVCIWDGLHTPGTHLVLLPLPWRPLLLPWRPLLLASCMASLSIVCRRTSLPTLPWLPKTPEEAAAGSVRKCTVGCAQCCCCASALHRPWTPLQAHVIKGWQGCTGHGFAVGIAGLTGDWPQLTLHGSC